MTSTENLTDSRISLEPPYSWTPPQFEEVRNTDGFRFATKLLRTAVDAHADKIELSYTRETVAVRLHGDNHWKAFRAIERRTGDALLVVLKQLAELNPVERQASQSGTFLAIVDQALVTCSINSSGVSTGELVVIEMPISYANIPEFPVESISHSQKQVSVQCPHCSNPVADDGTYTGQVVECPHCHAQFAMPARDQDSSAHNTSHRPPPRPSCSPPPRDEKDKTAPVNLNLSDDELIPTQRKVLHDYADLVERCQKRDHEAKRLVEETRERGRALMAEIWNHGQEARRLCLGVLTLFPVSPGRTAIKGETASKLLYNLEQDRDRMIQFHSELRSMATLLRTILIAGIVGLVISPCVFWIADDAAAGLSVGIGLLFCVSVGGLIASMGLGPYRKLVATYHSANATHERCGRRSEQECEEEVADILATYQCELNQLQELAATLTGKVESLAPVWKNQQAWEAWTPSLSMPHLLRVGDFTPYPTEKQKTCFGAEAVWLDESQKTVVLAKGWAAGKGVITVPAMIPFPLQESLLFEFTSESKGAAVPLMQTLTLQLLAHVPPGKAEFIFIDPVALGENFAMFMELKNYDDALVSHRVWTDQRHIEQRLADLGEKTEDIIQMYLRNEFETLDQYNAKAGEVAEPYRVLLVADFPVNFTEEAAKRLVSIAVNGPRCGVYAMIAWDTTQELPHGFPDLTNLRAKSMLFRPGLDGLFLGVEKPDYESYFLFRNSPPEAPLASRIIQEVGARSKDAKRVQVPFSFIAPSQGDFWTHKSDSGISAAVGKTGAAQRQLFELGESTSLHALICGRTGSGKTTLLHALVVNLALNYSPDELELYLVDFKEGVEFKRYAEFEVPHARVVAVESEREFGLSVLEGLYKEYERRGNLFKRNGTHDIRGYRQARPNERCPRILLMVDEFQEFFVADDKLSQDAALYLDALVRKGRAFGIHVVLGTQTLAGAYSLPRSTIDQIGVRIALQSSDADSRLILSDDNSAARLLSRPGEAIYNDANGLVEGNHPFQVAWIDSEECASHLRVVHVLATKNGWEASRPQIVFDGTAPSLVDKNERLRKALEEPDWPSPQRAYSAWIGEPVVIKDEPTGVVFRRQSGSNLLFVGQDDTSVLRMIATATFSLGAQQAGPLNGAPAKAEFYGFDLTPVDNPLRGELERFVGIIPHPAKSLGRRDVGTVFPELAREVERRLASDEAAASSPCIYVIIFGLQRARDLREDNDDGYRWTDSDEPPPPSAIESFKSILRDGPEVGIHTIVWCDNMNSLDRALGRRGLREFAMRVAMQMGEQDSSDLLDAPIASKLGPNRAFLFMEEEGTLEKFRPYAWTKNWWQFAGKQFRSKTQTSNEAPAT